MMSLSGSVSAILLALTVLLQSTSLHDGAHALTSSIKPRVLLKNLKTNNRNTRLDAKWSRPYFADDNDDDENEKERDRPTQTKTERYLSSISPAKPKIVVLGASGRIGRLVVSQLMEKMSSIDCTIVALVRDYKEALKIFYSNNGGMSLVSRNNKGGPQLQIVEADLVPNESLPGYKDPEEPIEEEDWKERATSASDFYGSKVEEYDNRAENPKLTSAYETLESAIRDCTSIISCVGAVRPTNVWTDLVQVPLWRLLKKDVSGWCRDKRHPYYVHYATTRQVLGLAESEQRRRHAAACVEAEQDLKNIDSVPIRVPRIRLVRISDLCVAQRAWDFVPLITNVLQSMVFRYQDMAERLLDESSVIDTVVLRPGDLMDEERDVDTISLQVDPSGSVPCPARVGRADVAALAVASALFASNEDAAAAKREEKKLERKEDEPFHYTLGVRWAGQDLHPFPPQGHKSDGLADANQCMKKVLKTEAQKAKRQRRLAKKRKNSVWPISLRKRRRRPLKPYGVCVAVLSYLFLGLFLTAFTKSILMWVPGGEHVMTTLDRVRNNAWGMVMKHVPKKPEAIVIPPPPKRIPFRNRRPSSTSYISF